jgi:HlyD family secretion protein
MSRWCKFFSVYLSAVATAGSVVLFAQEKNAAVAPQPESGTRASRIKDTPVHEVKAGMLRVVLIEPGTLQASRSRDVVCQVEGAATIISLLAEGSRVKKGDLVCELDSASFRDQLVNQKIATQGAEASYRNAKITREVAEIAIKEYVEGIYLQEKATIQGEIKLAESDLPRSVDRLERITKERKRLDTILAAKGEERTAVEIVADLDLDDRLESARIAVPRAKFALEQAQSKLNVLENYTKAKTIKDLKSEIEKALSIELARKQAYQLERDKEARLEKQIVNCKLFAPDGGIVVYANDLSRPFGSNAPQIEEGATVRERQRIFSLPDLGAPLLVNTKVRETMVARVIPGQRVRVKVHAFPAEPLPGVVVEVAPLPDPTSFFSSDRKVYSARVRLEKGLPGLRPGLSAQVEMFMTDLDDVLSVPLRAVIELRGRNYVYLVTPGSPARREVKLGLYNETMIEVREGLRAGDKVALDPIPLMSDEELGEAFAVSKEGKVGDVSPTAPKADGPAPHRKSRPPSIDFSKFRHISAEDREKMKTGSEDERTAILKKAGFTDAEIEAMKTLRGRNVPGDGPGDSRR